MMKWIKFEAITTDGKTVTRRDTIKNGILRNTLCSCDGKYKTKATAKRVLFDGKKCYCEECGKEFKVLDTSEAEKQRLQEQAEERNRKALETLHLYPAWNDWEATGQHYMLSARVDYDTWKLIKQYFTYYTKEMLEESEMESFDFITGWATRQPYEVERILLEKGLIKEENKLDNVLKRMEQERQERKRLSEKKRQEEQEKRQVEKRIKEGLNFFFKDDDNVSVLSDSEATHYLGRKGETVFVDAVNRFCVDDGYLIHSTNVGDYNYAKRVLLNDEMKSFIEAISI